MLHPCRNDQALPRPKDIALVSHLSNQLPFHHHDRLIAVGMRFHPFSCRLPSIQAHRRGLGPPRRFQDMKVVPRLANISDVHVERSIPEACIEVHAPRGRASRNVHKARCLLALDLPESRAMNRPSFTLFCAGLCVSAWGVIAQETPQQEPQVRMVNRVYMAVVNIKIDEGRGSGFFVTKDGHVVTNAHVIRNATDITVLTQDGQSLPAKVIGRSREIDIALLKVEPVRPPTIIPLEKESPNMIGQTMVAIGNPLGVGTSVTRGILSGRGRASVVDGREFDNLLQTDAPINPGNSGGPILDISGSLSGVTSIGTKGASGLSYAIPVNIVREKVDEFMKARK